MVIPASGVRRRARPRWQISLLIFGTTSLSAGPTGGTVFELVDHAVDFVLGKIDLSVGTRSESIQAPVAYVIPREVVVEAIVNAVAHRDYTESSSAIPRGRRVSPSGIQRRDQATEIPHPSRLAPSLALREHSASITPTRWRLSWAI